MNRILWVVLLLMFQLSAIYPMTMQESIQYGLLHNPELQYTKADLDLSLAGIQQNVRQFFPHVSMSYENGDTVQKNALDQRSKTVSVQLSQLIYDGGDTENSIRMAKVSYRISEYEGALSRATYMYEVLQGYLSLLKIKEKISIKNMQLSNDLKDMEITRKQVELGESTQLDLFEWEIEFKQSELDLAELSNQYDQELLSFKKTIRMPLEDGFEPEGRLNTGYQFHEEVWNQDELIEESVRNSLDLKKLEMQLEQGRIALASLQSFSPDVSLNLSYSSELDRMLRPENEWSVGLSFSFPFFFDKVSVGPQKSGTLSAASSGENLSVSSTVLEDWSWKSQQQSQEISIRKLITQYQETKETLALSIKQGIHDLQFTIKKLALLDEKIRLSEQKALIQKEQVRLGESQLSDYVKLLNSIQESRLSRVDTVYEYVNLKVTLLKTIGKLSQESVEQTAGLFVIE